MDEEEAFSLYFEMCNKLIPVYNQTRIWYPTLIDLGTRIELKKDGKIYRNMKSLTTTGRGPMKQLFIHY